MKSASTAIFKCLDIYPLERINKGEFKPITDAPFWFEYIFSEHNPTDLFLASPGSLTFLGNFLVDAEEFWEKEKLGQLRSGYWIENFSDGSEQYFEARAICTSESKNLLIEHLGSVSNGFFGLMQTARKKILENEQLRHYSQSLRTVNQKHHKLLEGFPDLILRVSKDSNILDITSKQKGFGEFHLLDSCKTSLADIFADSVADQIHKLVLTTLKSNTSESFNFCSEDKSYEVRVLKSERDEAIAVVRDVTEREQVKEELKEAKEKAESANISKGRFLASMSHEIRTPLGAVIGFAEMLQSFELSEPESKEAISAIVQSGRHLLSIVNDILDLSKIEANQIEIRKEKFLLYGLVQDVSRLFKLSAKEKDIEFSVEYVEPLVKEIESDPSILRQILLNLLGNALKFTAFGKVKLKVFNYGDNQCLKFEIEDSGIGMNKSQIDNIFEPFVQGDPMIAKVYGGTGLGLAIVKNLSDRIGASLSVNSQIGKGTTFSLEISASSDDFEEISLEAASRLYEENRTVSTFVNPKLSAKVLFAEDDSINQLLVRRLLERSGCSIKIVKNGLEALEEMKSNEYDLVLLDINMPEMDGVETTRELRNRGVKKPIIALSAAPLQSQIDDCLESGCNAHISKPFSTSQFFSVIKEQLEKKN